MGEINDLKEGTEMERDMEKEIVKETKEEKNKNTKGDSKVAGLASPIDFNQLLNLQNSSENSDSVKSEEIENVNNVKKSLCSTEKSNHNKIKLIQKVLSNF